MTYYSPIFVLVEFINSTNRITREYAPRELRKSVLQPVAHSKARLFSKCKLRHIIR